VIALEATLSKFLGIAFLTVTVALGAAADQKTQPGQPLVAKIDGAHVTVTGATAGGRVAFFGVGRFVKQYRVTVRRFDKVVADDDKDGSVVLDIGEKLPWKTIFVAVDFSTGHYALVTPEGFPLMPIPFKKEIMVANKGQLDHLLIEHRFCYMALVRPGVGFWGQILGDGNKYDEDGVGDGKVTADVGRSVSVDGNVPAPAKFEKGDILVLIDPMRMQSYAVEVGSK
jgi:hypothetical protein